MKIVVVSPHLDDGVWSIGAIMRRWVRQGHDVICLTVFAGVDSAEPASKWDVLCGFATEAEATDARRQEDRKACASLGVAHAWLDHRDDSYSPDRDGNSVWADIEPHLEGVDVVVCPGWPRHNPDHQWLGELLDARLPARLPAVMYAEQPYAAFKAVGRQRHDPPLISGRFQAPYTWLHEPMGVRGVLRKARAAAKYVSQIRTQKSDLRAQLIYELSNRTEAIAWPDEAPEMRSALSSIS